MRRRTPPIAVIAATTAAAIALGGCGGGKPAYCSAQTDLKNAVEGLGNVSSASELKSSLQKIQSSANSLIASVKTDFPSETDAIKSSLSALEATVKEATSNPQAAIKQLPGEVSAMGTAIDSFAKAAKSKCS
jgi:hypothetical protein